VYGVYGVFGFSVDIAGADSDNTCMCKPRCVSFVGSTLQFICDTASERRTQYCGLDAPGFKRGLSQGGAWDCRRYSRGAA
jgi:hypothetical protein